MEESVGPFPHTGVLRLLVLHHFIGEGNELAYLIDIDRIGTNHIDLILNPTLVHELVPFSLMLMVECLLCTVHEVLYQVVDDW